MACNQCYPTSIENSNTKYLIGYFPISLMIIHVRSRHKHPLQTSVRYISAQSYGTYVTFYEIADNGFIDCILE